MVRVNPHDQRRLFQLTNSKMTQEIISTLEQKLNTHLSTEDPLADLRDELDELKVTPDLSIPAPENPPSEEKCPFLIPYVQLKKTIKLKFEPVFVDKEKTPNHQFKNKLDGNFERLKNLTQLERDEMYNNLDCKDQHIVDDILQKTRKGQFCDARFTFSQLL